MFNGIVSRLGFGPNPRASPEPSPPVVAPLPLSVPPTGASRIDDHTGFASVDEGPNSSASPEPSPTVVSLLPAPVPPAVASDADDHAGFASDEEGTFQELHEFGLSDLPVGGSGRDAAVDHSVAQPRASHFTGVSIQGGASSLRPGASAQPPTQRRAVIYASQRSGDATHPPGDTTHPPDIPEGTHLRTREEMLAKRNGVVFDDQFPAGPWTCEQDLVTEVFALNIMSITIEIFIVPDLGALLFKC